MWRGFDNQGRALPRANVFRMKAGIGFISGTDTARISENTVCLL